MRPRPKPQPNTPLDAGKYSRDVRGPIKLRPLQKAVVEENQRHQVACWHRRAGKTVTAIEWLKDGHDPNREKGDYRGYYACPLARQAKQNAWDFLLKQTEHLSGVKPNAFELCIDFANGDRIQLIGANEYWKHRGKYIDRIALDEVADMPPAAWAEVFRPALSDRKGKSLMIGTPRGMDHFRQYFDYGAVEHLKGWRSWYAPANETGILDQEELEFMMRDMGAERYAQEMLCDWNIARLGAFFSRQMNAATKEGRVDEYMPDMDLPTYVAINIPNADTLTASWWQQDRKGWRCIDEYHGMNESMDDAAREIKAKPYYVDGYIAPATAREGAGTRVAALRANGVRVRVAPPLEQIDQIANAKMLIARSRFNYETCKNTVEGLRQFHAEFDENRRAFTSKPVYDWSAEYSWPAMALASTVARPRRSDWNKPLTYTEDRLVA